MKTFWKIVIVDGVAALVVLGLIAWLAPEWLRGPAAAEAERGELERRRAELDARAGDLDHREAVLARHELLARSALASAQAYRARAAADREAAEALAMRRSTAAFDATVDIVSRAEVGAALAILSPWADAEVARALASMRASRAAELVEGMRADAAWRERIPRLLAPAQQP